VVALLVPGVGEKDMDTGKAFRFEHLRQHLDGIVLDDAHVGEAALAELL